MTEKEKMLKERYERRMQGPVSFWDAAGIIAFCLLVAFTVWIACFL